MKWLVKRDEVVDTRNLRGKSGVGEIHHWKTLIGLQKLIARKMINEKEVESGILD